MCHHSRRIWPPVVHSACSHIGALACFVNSSTQPKCANRSADQAAAWSKSAVRHRQWTPHCGPKFSPYLFIILARHHIDSHHLPTSSACASLSAVPPRASAVRQSLVLRRKVELRLCRFVLSIRSSVVRLVFHFLVAISAVSPFPKNAVVVSGCGSILDIYVVLSSRLSFQHPNSQHSNPECDSSKRASTAWRCVIGWISPSAFGLRPLVVSTICQQGSCMRSGELKASRQWQNTFVYDAFSPCDNPANTESAIQCSAVHGGFFDNSSSTTWKEARNMSAAGGALDTNQGNGVLEDNAWGTDTFRINSTLALEDFPIGVARTTSLFTEVGLARNSTLVDALYAKGAIGSKSWGLSMGWQGADPLHQADGSLVLGGYDIARTNGNNSTYPISGDTARGDCPGGLVVTIRDIVLNQKNGSSPSILPSSAGSVLQACIDPAFSVLQFPSDIYENFLDNTYSPLVADTYRNGKARSTGVNFWGMLFPAEDVYVLRLDHPV